MKEYVERVSRKHKTIEVMSQTLTNLRDKVEFRCKVCGFCWTARADTVLYNNGCKKCNKIKSKERYSSKIIRILKKEKPNIVMLGEYTTANDKTLFKCLVEGCLHEWETTPHNMLHSKIGCPKCVKNIKLTQEEFVYQMKESNKDITVIGSYVNNRTPILVRCEIDGFKWEATPDNLKSKKTGCPVCSESQIERVARQYFERNGIVYEKEFYSKWTRQKRYDFKVGRTLIELDGGQHFSNKSMKFFKISLDKQIKNDALKNELAVANGYKLIRISHTEIKNIEKILNENIIFDYPRVVCFGKEYIRMQQFNS